MSAKVALLWLAAALSAAAQYPAPALRLLDATFAPKGGYWALEPDPAADPSGKHRNGRLIATLPARQVGSLSLSGLLIVADWTSQSFDGTALFYLHDPYGSLDPTDINRPRILYQDLPLDLTLENTPPTLFADATKFMLNNPYAYSQVGLVVQDSGGYVASFATAVPLDATMGLQLDSNSIVTWSGNYNGNTNLFDATAFHVLFRYYPDSSVLTQLDEGEVALYQSCNYQGKATVFAVNTPDFAALTSSDTTLDKTARSIRLGNNTAVTLYSGAGYTGASQLLTADTECLDSLPIGAETTAIKLEPLVDVAIATKSCEGCQLAGVNLTKYTLSDINFNGANLTGAVLEGAVLNGTHLEKTVLDKATGLKGIDLSNNVVATGVSLQGVDLTGAILNGTQLDGAVLTGATLTGIKTVNTNLQQATLSGALGLEGMDLSQAQLQGAVFHGTNLSQVTLPPVMDNADLSGATLTGIKFQNISVSQAIFDGATGLAGADLSLVDFSNTSMRNMNLGGTLFYGAFLNGADLEGSNLSGAYFTNNLKANIPNAAKLAGAHLKNVNLSSAYLTGATFTDASFYGTVPALQGICNIDSDGFTKLCATASGATLNGANFGSAYLYGVDFTHSHIFGVNFGNAVLVGANFSQAELTNGGQGSDTGFTSAFLQGANLADATLTGTSLQNAFLDFRAGGNSMYLNLDGTHTTFPNWKTPGQRACVFIYYTVPTAVPVSNTTLTCPDGNPAGIKGCGRTSKANTRWASKTDISQTDPPASYLNDATYTNAAPAICDGIAPW